MLISNAYAQTAAAAPTGLDGLMQSQLPLMIVMFLAVWFMMIRPQMKRQKEHKAMIAALAKGDEVIVAGGLLGKVTKLNDQYVGVEIAAGTEVLVQKTAVVAVLPKGTLKAI